MEEVLIIKPKPKPKNITKKKTIAAASAKKHEKVQTEGPVAAATAATLILKEDKRKRCPKGTRKNLKTGECEPMDKPTMVKPSENIEASASIKLASTLNNQPLEKVRAEASSSMQLETKTSRKPIEIIAEVGESAEIAEDKIINDNREEKEIKEWNIMTHITPETDNYAFLYPSLNDPNFNIKIAERKEFNDNRYDGQIYDAKQQSDILCNTGFELAPQQLFVRNFLSVQTPYNSLLLYHGLGSGKTCSAISVAEEMREYHKQMDINNRIIVVASPNVQENFKVQLFDDSKLKEVNGLWNISSCTGNNLLKEINPMNMTGLTKENVSAQIKQIINKYYVFMGYTGFANYIIKVSSLDTDEKITAKKREALIRNKLRKVFNNRLIIIDEVQNIRQTDDNSDKKRVSFELFKLVKNVDNLRLLLLSATPMYNSYKEIIWLINLMNINDKRATIETKDVFDANGNFKLDENGEEVGKELLERKATGYISYVRGENPYTFPYRLFPKEFAPEKTFSSGNVPTSSILYPRTQLNGVPIVQGIERISLYLVEMGEYQQKAYNTFIEKLKNEKSDISFEGMERFGYNHLKKPLQALNMIYPAEELDDIFKAEKPSYDTLNTGEFTGESGLTRIMKFDTMAYNKETGGFPYRYNFDYQTDNNYGKIFSPSEIGKYSGKIKGICDNILNSTGIVMVYTEYIDGGIIPLALALEELGFIRGDTPTSLLKARTPPIKKIDAISFKTEVDHKNSEEYKNYPFTSAKYIMITGDKGLSPNNAEIIKKVNNENNKDGRNIKVVLFSQAGSEGLDYKCIRQVHIMDPWYNMSRIEQIIGRAVRTCSHKNLPFEKRNVEIYLYGSLFSGEDKIQKEAVDLYVYRLAELKAVQIGNVSRVLKEISVDCILNYAQADFTVDNMNQQVELELPRKDKKKIMFTIGDKPFSATCDYSETCNYVCRPNKEINEEDIKMDTYNEYFITNNTDKIIQKIKTLMRAKFFYRKTDLLIQINLTKEYPLVQINAALDQLIQDKYEYLTDKYGRLGNLINIDDLYLFQPLEIKNVHISLHDRTTPIDVKRDNLVFKLPKMLEEIVIKPGKKGQAVVAEVENIRREKELIKILAKLEEIYTSGSKIGEVMSRGDDDWYKICSSVLQSLEKEGITDREILLDILVEHMIDELKLDEMMRLLNGLETLDSAKEFENRLKRIVEKNIMTVEVNSDLMLTGILVNNNGENNLIIKKNMTESAGAASAANIWSLAEPLDKNDFKSRIEEYTQTFLPALDKMNTLVGFMSIFKKEEGYIVFKTKDLTKKRNKGARCDQAGKEEALKILNSIIDESDQHFIQKEKIINRKQVCVIQEIILRLYNKNKTNGKIWFLSAVESNLIEIEKL